MKRKETKKIDYVYHKFANSKFQKRNFSRAKLKPQEHLPLIAEPVAWLKLKKH